MNTPRIEDSLLQRLFDGDLSADEHEDVTALLDESAVDRGRQKALERLGGFVADVATEDAALLTAQDSMSMFDAVLLGIDKNASTTSDADAPAVSDEGSAPRKRPKLRLIEGEGLGTLPPRSEKVAFEPKLGMPEKSAPAPAAPKKPADQGARWPGLVAVVALAAAAVLAIALRPDGNVRPGEPGTVAEVVTPQPNSDPQVVVEEDPEVIVASHLGTEVEEVDFGSNIGTVFQVPGEQDVPVAVVWISDEEFVR